MNGYTVAPTNNEASERWKFGTEGHTLMRQAVESALDAGVFYSNAFQAYCAKFMNVSEYEQDIDKRSPQGRRVEGGPFWYEVYTCRKIIEKERYAVKDAIVRDKLSLSVGQKIGKIRLNDGKLVMGSTIEQLTPSHAILTGRRGSQTLRVTLTYMELNTRAQRAGNRVFCQCAGL